MHHHARHPSTIHPQATLGQRIWQRIKQALFGLYADVQFA